MIIKKQTAPLNDNKTMISFIKNSVNNPIKKSWFVRSFLFQKRIKAFLSKKRTEDDRIEESVFILQLLVNYASLFKNSFEKEGGFLKEELRVLSCDCSQFCQTHSFNSFINETAAKFLNSFGFNQLTLRLLYECYNDRLPIEALHCRVSGLLVYQSLLMDNKLQELREKFFGEEKGFFLLEEELIAQALINYYNLRLTQEGKVKRKDFIIDEQELLGLLDPITINSIRTWDNTELVMEWLEERYSFVCCEKVLTELRKELLLIARKGNKLTELLFCLIKVDYLDFFASRFVSKNRSYEHNPLLLLVQSLLDTAVLDKSELRALKDAIVLHKKSALAMVSDCNKALRFLYKKHPLLLFS